MVQTRTLLPPLFLTLMWLLVLPQISMAAAPSNDDRAAARALTLPAALDGTTKGATLEDI